MSTLRDRILAEIAERERWLPVVAYADEVSKQRARKRRHEFDLSTVELQEIAAALERQGEKEAEYQTLVDDGLSAYEAAGTVWPEPQGER